MRTDGGEKHLVDDVEESLENVISGRIIGISRIINIPHCPVIVEGLLDLCQSTGADHPTLQLTTIINRRKAVEERQSGREKDEGKKDGRTGGGIVLGLVH